MTISIGKPRYMTKDQIKDLSERGNVIACHTWDHHSVKKYTDTDWDIQLTKPKALLESITGSRLIILRTRLDCGTKQPFRI